MKVHEEDGPRGGAYFTIDLPDGRIMGVSRKPHDERCWIGRRDDPGSFQGQAGGVGKIEAPLSEWRGQLALNDEVLDLYSALSALQAIKGRNYERNGEEVHMDEKDFLQRIRGTKAELVRLRDHAVATTEQKGWTDPLNDTIEILEASYNEFVTAGAKTT